MRPMNRIIIAIGNLTSDNFDPAIVHIWNIGYRTGYQNSGDQNAHCVRDELHQYE